MKTKDGVVEFEPGIYRHYKGGLYRALFVAADHHTREPVVVYASLKQGSLNVRPLNGPDGWNTPHLSAGGVVKFPRFEFVNDSLDGME